MDTALLRLSYVVRYNCYTVNYWLAGSSYVVVQYCIVAVS